MQGTPEQARKRWDAFLRKHGVRDGLNMPRPGAKPAKSRWEKREKSE